MASLRHILDSDKTLRTIGFDDAPRPDGAGEGVGLAGVVCKDARFDGMVWGEVKADGWDATQTVVELLENGKFLPQLHLVLLDGIAFGGFNVVDLEALARRLQLPCATVMRRRPDFGAIERALEHVGDVEERLETMRRAGRVHEADSAFFQVRGTEPEVCARALDRVTRDGHIPEPVRIAHMVAAAVVTGESGKRA